ncbi:4Fe-4S dicluster domain-containing protein [Halomonas sp. ML-15]|uniref:4Fe-4S dicluster domain-containing protein n=1 Tax=Halomonas sp. ML-15 TaxID=2773305 RepID=UPI001747D4CA|nr:4Fe-4S dicluster domain-containing protein [Halomonas sp. ML-15]MBD3894393.1 4Fe-4S dicluster domain-containing protein [Halomonas sp. ML-15]
MTQRIALTQLDAQHNRQAQSAALARVSWPTNLTPANVSYQSQGHLLVIGQADACRHACDALTPHLHDDGLRSITLMVDAAGKSSTSLTELPDGVICQRADLTKQSLTISGYLGRFSVVLESADDSIDLAKASLTRPHFDLVLDLGDAPCLTLELPPPGYLAARPDTPAFAEALAALPEMVGEFDKPKYFHIDHDLCAHAGRGQPGCTRCLEACPADAIVSQQKRIEAWIEIDPFRCHGAGSCTAACPTGAIQYRLPQPQAQQDYVARLLAAYREADGQLPVVRFADRATLDEQAAPAGNLLDVPLEEVGAAGLDDWLAALAQGACEVRVLRPAVLPARMAAQIDDQLHQAQAILEALGHDPQRILLHDASAELASEPLPHLPALAVAPSPTGGKRERLNATLDWLAQHGEPTGERHALPANAPFGGLVVDTAACTLCMSCVAVCPTTALAGGESQPQLSFREADCVQCGLCDSACPENAIALAPGFMASEQRSERVICKQEAPFECISCGKPFATASTIASIKAKLADHPYFAGDAMARLEMCEDCRVKDVWHELARNPNAQLKV